MKSLIISIVVGLIFTTLCVAQEIVTDKGMPIMPPPGVSERDVCIHAKPDVRCYVCRKFRIRPVMPIIIIKPFPCFPGEPLRLEPDPPIMYRLKRVEPSPLPILPK
jgi:hypothetical protein